MPEMGSEIIRNFKRKLKNMPNLLKRGERWRQIKWQKEKKCHSSQNLCPDPVDNKEREGERVSWSVEFPKLKEMR